MLVFILRYHQLKAITREQIVGGDSKPGSPIPSARELSERYGVSRMTARQSMFTELAGLLGIAVGSPVLLLPRATYTERLASLEYAESVYRATNTPSTRALSARERG